MILCVVSLPVFFLLVSFLSKKSGNGPSATIFNEYLATQKATVKVLNLGIPDEFIKHGTQQQMHDEMGLGEQGILTTIKAFMS